MALINTLKLTFTEGGSPDRVLSRLRVGLAGDAVDYTTPAVDIAGPTTDIDLSTLMPDADGVYDLYITDVDNAGNESDFLVISGVTVDFLAPNAPTGGSVA